jgi:hypothetical protein
VALICGNGESWKWCSLLAKVGRVARRPMVRAALSPSFLVQDQRRPPDESMDYFFLQLAIIFLPGLIWERIATKYALKRPPTQFETGLRTFTFGLAAYTITYAIYALLGSDFVIPEFRRDASFLEKRFVWQFATTLAVAVVCAIGWLYLLNKQFFARFLRKIGATKSFGQEDVWDYVLNLSDPTLEWVYVRDFESEQIYKGWIHAFSQNPECRELLLERVEVFDLAGTRLYELPLMLISRPKDSLHIEFPLYAGQTNG